MYRVTVMTDGEEYVIHDINSQDEQIYDDTLSEEMGKTAEFCFTISSSHPNIRHLLPLRSEVRVYKDTERIFWGRIITPSADIFNTETVKCVGGLSYLADSLQAPFELSGTGVTFLRKVLEVHNSQVENYKKLQLGIVTVSIKDATRKIDRYADTLNVLMSILVKNYGGYLRVREDGNIRYLDYLTNYNGTNSQEIRFGENILDLSSEIDATDIITILIPEGAKDSDGNPIDITSVNGGVNYVQNVQAVARWGRIWGAAQFPEIHTPAELLAAARDYLEKVTAFPQTISLTAFDLSVTDASIEALKLGYWTNLVSEPHGLQGTYLLQKLERHLTAPQNDRVTFGIVKNTISGQTSNTSQIVTEEIEQVKQSIGKEMDEKIENATKLITGGTGGYVVIGTNKQGQPNEIYILDAPTAEAAVHVIRMNQNGIGFSTTGKDGPYTNAWTIDGNLVADFITAGTMLADRIRGGVLEIGGKGLGKDGVIYIKNAAGATIGTISQNGISFTAGSINLGNGAFEVDSNGKMSVSGTNNSSSIGCETLRAIGANIDNLVVGGNSEFSGNVVANDILAEYIQCTRIYSSDAGESWSDARLKKDVAEIPTKVCYKIVKNLKPVEFTFKQTGSRHIGFIAQDVAKVLREENVNLPIVGELKGYLTLPYASYVALLAGALQEQGKEIKALRTEVLQNGRYKQGN